MELSALVLVSTSKVLCPTLSTVEDSNNYFARRVSLKNALAGKTKQNQKTNKTTQKGFTSSGIFMNFYSILPLKMRQCD